LVSTLAQNTLTEASLLTPAFNASCWYSWDASYWAFRREAAALAADVRMKSLSNRYTLLRLYDNIVAGGLLSATIHM
jgi:hypothetical protein